MERLHRSEISYQVLNSLFDGQPKLARAVTQDVSSKLANKRYGIYSTVGQNLHRMTDRGSLSTTRTEVVRGRLILSYQITELGLQELEQRALLRTHIQNQ